MSAPGVAGADVGVGVGAEGLDDEVLLAGASRRLFDVDELELVEQAETRTRAASTKATSADRRADRICLKLTDRT